MIVVVGAGSFGAWIAYELARSGREVTLVDARGPGNARSSSGGATRVIRMGYGAREIYTRWSMRSFERWRELFARTDPTLFRETGVLLMARDGDELSAATRATLERAGVEHEILSRAQLESRWPQIDFGSISWAIHEPRSGVIRASRAVEAVAGEAERAGARTAVAAVRPPSGSGRLGSVSAADGTAFRGDAFVFACGPWLAKLFPEILGSRLFVTRQCVFYLRPPTGDARFASPACPAWIDFGAGVYGLPDLDSRGFKAAFDRHGPPFDPDTGDRSAREMPDALRADVEARFPALRGAPTIGCEVCQYENTSNGDFLIDRHPGFDNVWLAGGGSGHGFKHGPAVGEYCARLVTEGGEPEDVFRLDAKQDVQRRAVF